MNVHILLVEDDEALRIMVGHTLRKAGYQVTQSPSGEHALELLSLADSQRVQYDLVLTDIVMHEINGIEVLQVARSLPNAPDVILLTGHGSLQTAIEAVRHNAFDYLLKPCPKDVLLERVEACLSRRFSNRSTPSSVEPSLSAVEHTSSINQAAVTTPETEQAPDNHTEHRRYLQVGHLQIDTHRHEIRFGDETLHITPTEYAILTCLATTPGRVVTYGDIVQQIRGYQVDESQAHDLLRAHIRNLRRKFDRRYLASVYAVGYMLTEPDDQADSDIASDTDWLD